MKIKLANLTSSSIKGYEEDFKKAMHQAIFFISDLDIRYFCLTKNVVDSELVNDIPLA